MAFPKPANRPRLAIGNTHRARLHDRSQRFLHPPRPTATVSMGGESGKAAIGAAVQIIAGAAKGRRGVVVFNSGGVAYVRTEADVVKVPAGYLAAIDAPQPPLEPR